jgi:hypothetical protein
MEHLSLAAKWEDHPHVTMSAHGRMLWLSAALNHLDLMIWVGTRAHRDLCVTLRSEVVSQWKRIRVPGRMMLREVVSLRYYISKMDDYV